MKIQASTRMQAAEKHISFPDNPEAVVKEFADIIQKRSVAWKGDPRYNAGHYLYTLRRQDPAKANRVAELMESQADAHESLPERTMRQGIAVLRGKSANL